MLIEFSVGNYLSFKDVVTFSMVAADTDEHKNTHTFEEKDYRLLKSAALYGANASGKSNLFKAMKFARNFIYNSSKESQTKEPIKVEPFMLSDETEKEPSFFEFVFIKADIKYRYGFKANKTEITDEWLFKAEDVEEKNLFERSYQDIKVEDNFDEGKELLELIKKHNLYRRNTLFISLLAQFNNKTGVSLIEWFSYLFVLAAIDDNKNWMKDISLDILLKDESVKNQFLEILKIADISIEDFHIIAEYGLLKIKTIHKKYNKNKDSFELVEFDLEQQESHGTKKLFSLAPILRILNQGNILIVDELDASLHPLISTFLIKMFNSNKHNPNNAQLIFNTHDTNLLDKELFRRDQIWFTEKDDCGATELYSLDEYEEDKKERVLAKDYLRGRYGAIPFIGDYDFFDEDEDK